MATNAFVRPNPAMTKGFERAGTATGDRMTLNGTLGCTFTLLALVVGTGVLGWLRPSAPLAIGAMLVALVLGLVIGFKPNLAPKLAVVYALLEGYFLGVISKYFEDEYNGIVLTAVALTVGIAFALLAVYRSGLIPVTQNFRLGVAAATLGIFLVYIGSFVGGLFGFEMPLVNSNSGWGIAFSVFVVLLASANLVVDFDFIESGVNSGAPKYMEWFGAFALMVTLVWLYLELLRLLAKIMSNR